jgi:Transglycosylase-like domain
VRTKLTFVLAALGLAAAPAAQAADPVESPVRPGGLVPRTLLDSRWKRAKQDLEERQREAKQRRAAANVSVPPQLASIAQCESGGNPRAIGGGGAYRGKYQFDTGTWASVGGQGDPAAAPEAEQDRRAAILYARSGPGQWPVCGS